MKLGNITVQPIVEMVHPYCLPEDALPQATPEAMAPHRHWLEPWFLCGCCLLQRLICKQLKGSY